MHKLMLNLEDLTVESFATTVGMEARGTVDAHASLDNNTNCGTYCQTEAYRLTCAPTNCTEGYDDSDDGFCPSVPATCVGCPPQTYGHTCYGHTGCGTCPGAVTCDLDYGCSGNSMDMQPC
ncbi:MAG TPA: pinensin family lanthipeptide [Longimicrobium sp.]|nr:pinensin family lanthipeptide [Longimicrobium sp.]